MQRLPVWGTTLGSRTTRMPKVHLVDAGVKAWQLGLTPEKLVKNDPSVLTEYGHLVETFAARWSRRSGRPAPRRDGVGPTG